MMQDGPRSLTVTWAVLADTLMLASKRVSAEVATALRNYVSYKNIPNSFCCARLPWPGHAHSVPVTHLLPSVRIGNEPMGRCHCFMGWLLAIF